MSKRRKTETEDDAGGLATQAVRAVQMKLTNKAWDTEAATSSDSWAQGYYVVVRMEADTSEATADDLGYFAFPIDALRDGTCKIPRDSIPLFWSSFQSKRKRTVICVYFGILSHNSDPFCVVANFPVDRKSNQITAG